MEITKIPTQFTSTTLLELATSYDFSGELKIEVKNFLAKLSNYLQLDLAVCWQKKDKNANSSAPIFAFPTNKRCCALQNQHFYQYLEKQNFTIINDGAPYDQEARELIIADQGHFIFFNTSSFLIGLYRKKESFQQQEGDFFLEQIKRFSEYVALAFERDILQENITAEKTREKLLLNSKEKFQEEKLTEKNELLEAQSIMEIMFKNMQDGVFVYNYVEERIIDYNDAAFKMFGYQQREELIGLSRYQFVPQYSKYFPKMDFHEYTRGHGIKICNGESIHKTAGIFVKQNKEQFFVEANVIPTHRQKGEAFIIFRDTTERLLAQKELKLREKKYREIFENSHEAIIYFDVKKNTIFDCNQQTLRLFDLENKEIFIGSKFSEFFSVSKNETKAITFFATQINKATKGKKANFQFWAQSKKKKIFRAEGNLIVETNKKGHQKLVIFIRDITDKYNAERRLQAQHQKLKKYIESNMELENFAYLASHDLKSPLTTIISFTQILQKTLMDKMTKREQECMKFIVNATKSMQNLIEDLLNFSLVNNSSISITNVNINELLVDIQKEIQVDLHQKKAILQLPKEKINIQGDKLKLKQLFQNLISNALKFVKADKQPNIKISYEDRGTHLYFSIQDNGIGIEEQFKDRIFLLFKRLHREEQYQGTGIGLALCKKIVEQHQGEIGFQSVMEQGTTFYFTIHKKIVV